MKNENIWKPSKFIVKNNKFKTNRDIKSIYYYSRIYCDNIADRYNFYINKYMKGNLIDIGCGDVPLYQMYKNIVTSITCLDWQNSIHRNIHVDMEQNLNERLNILDNMYDSVIISEVLEHIINPFHLIDEIYRITKKDGFVLLSVPFFYEIHEYPYDYFRYTKHSLESIFIKSGFKVINIEEIGGAIEILGCIIVKLIGHIPFIGKLLSMFLQIIVVNFGKTSLGRIIKNKSSNVFPMAYILIAQKE